MHLQVPYDELTVETKEYKHHLRLETIVCCSMGGKHLLQVVIEDVFGLLDQVQIAWVGDRREITAAQGRVKLNKLLLLKFRLQVIELLN